MNAGAELWLNQCKPETNKAAENARGRQKSSSITVGSTARGAVIIEGVGKLTEVYNRELAAMRLSRQTIKT